MVEAMQLRGMTKQHALAFAMGVNESTITRWKNNRPMSIDHAVLLCRTLDVSLDWLLTGAGRIDAVRPCRQQQTPEGESSFLSCMRRAEAALTEQSSALLVSFVNSLLDERGRP
ncbi:helix-turn-helix domain-containing protein [Rhodopseudomonas pseudopalustris]|uniref:Helix-turn-helix n=1 Tax=Rhodopseudomonas pseudopalustris TaxID=1513892 RepID=A0A1H8T700_9BRAD|nr:helix-turn-helix transcriptional regulator [Rhodopseudomonas pseudopalustris]SEO86691.1 Helix-turn-helix [Rhodopseudomonas pseudopalustris]